MSVRQEARMETRPRRVAAVSSGRTPAPARTSILRSSDARMFFIAVPMPLLVIAGTALGVPVITLAGVLGTLAVALVSPAIGLVALALLAPTKPLLILPAPGFMFFLVAALFVGYLFRLPIDRPRLSIGPIVLLALGIGLYTFVQQAPDMASGFAGREAYAVGYKVFQFAAAIGAVLVGALILQGRSPYPVMAALITGALFVAVLAMASFDVREPTGVLANLLPEPDEGARATGTFGNPNYFGFFIATAMVLSIGLLQIVRVPGMRLLLMGAVAVLGFSLALSLSRGALTAFMVGVLTLAFLRSRRTGLIATAITAATVLLAYPLFVEFRLTMLTGAAEEATAGIMANSDAGRLGAVLTGPIIWLTSPIFGIGFGRFLFASGEVLATDGTVAHNWYMTVLAEQGVVGITLWVLLLLAVVAAMRKRPVAPRTVGLALLASTAAGFLFLQPPTAFQSAALPAIGLAAALVAAWSPREALASAPSREHRALRPRPR